MTAFLLLLTCGLFSTSAGLPQGDIGAFALNPAEINTLYNDPDSLNPLRDIPPEPIIKPNVEDTVKEVEALILANPKLPRLTRGEIIDIIENITHTEKKTREDGKRALMVVMPFTAGSAQGDDIRELYTRTPVTRIIGEVDENEEKKKKKIKKPPRKWPLFPEINIENEVLTGDKDTKNVIPMNKDVITINKDVKPINKGTIPKFQFLPDTRPRPTTTTTTTERITKKISSTTKPVLESSVTTYKPRYTGTWPTLEPVKTEEHTTILSPVSPKPKPSRKQKPQKFSNHKYPGEKNDGMRVISPPVLLPVVDDGYSAPYTISMKKPQFQSPVFTENNPVITENKPLITEQNPVLTEHKPVFTEYNPVITEPQHHLRPHATIEEVKITPDMYGPMPKLKKPQGIVSITSTERTILDDIAIPDQYKGVIKGLDLIIGPEHKTPQIKQVIKEVKPHKVETPTRQPTGQPTTQPTRQPSSNIMPDITNVADNLSPDMKELLMSFGLINKPTTKRPEITTEAVRFNQKAEISPQSYASFKPLPSGAGRNDMDDFLSRFGLGRNSFRSQKAISMDKPKKVATKTSELNFEAVPNHLKNVVFDLGFTTKNIKDVYKQDPKHIFNPSIQSASTEAELEKLGKLLDMIKDLEKMHGNITKENLKNFDTATLKELIGNLNGNSFVPLNEQDAPNPLDLEYNLVKNGTKREETTLPTEEVTISPKEVTISSEDVTISPQEVTTVVYASSDDSKEDSLEDLEASSGGLAATPITTVKPVEATSEDSKSASLGDLEASFGAMVENPVTTEAPTTTTAIRTGFYYLLDWNTFWEMDNQNGRRLNLRFQPHAGNPRYFQSVTVP